MPGLSLFERALQWADLDPNEKTSSYVRSLTGRAQQGDTNDAEAASGELEGLFPRDGSRIAFGTAGLRSSMAPGPLKMNDLVIIQTTQGLARYCQANCERSKKLLAVVGFDHRCRPEFGLSSRRFAMLTKLVFLEAGMDCILLDSSTGYVHTPLVSYATIELGAAVGVMVTASHNPKCDNGFKVYWSDGVQLRPPLDSGIASSIGEHDNLTPWTDYGTLLRKRKEDSSDSSDLCFCLSDPGTTIKLAEKYFRCIRSCGLVTGQARLLREDGWLPPSFAYTAMHGVGYQWSIKSFETFCLEPFKSVPSQESPDPTFPTVSFPNPEEKGALDDAMAFSEENSCDIILANDPDADRLAVAERDRVDGSWTVFTGDQIGTMLGEWLYMQIGKHSEKPIAMVASTVSSAMLSTIAKREGFHFEDTLTGFKWIGSSAVTLNSHDYRTLFAYEEAIGFSYPDIIPDKDGISSLSIMAELAYAVYHDGKNLKAHMQELYTKYGEFVSNNSYYFCYDPMVAQQIFSDFQSNGRYPTSIAGYDIEAIRYLGEPGYDSQTADKKPRLETSKSSPMLTVRFTNGCIAQFRASGTEPKFKYYIEMRGEPGVSRDRVQEDLLKMSDRILEELLQPEKNGLVVPR